MSKELKILNPEQKEALAIMQAGDNVFLTGSAGTGKSFLLQAYYDYLKSTGQFNVSRTSTTGVSALNIGGQTIHSWAGIGLGTDSFEDIYKRLGAAPYDNWRHANVLFIDEISMLSPTVFELLERLARMIRHSPAPFGGIQIILSGDFYQLPCVKSASLCFQSPKWDEVIKRTITLKTVVRQQDTQFVKMLNEIRFGECSDETADILTAKTIPSDELEKRLNDRDRVLPTKLFPKNRDVNYINDLELGKLIKDGAESATFKAKYYVKDNVSKKKNEELKEEYKKKAENILSPELTLAVGTQVMFKKNDTNMGVANGTRGVIVRFSKEREEDKEVYPVVK
jgi:ATP-dependent DNA helicase PIF1